MAYKFIEPRLGLPPITSISSVGTTSNFMGGNNPVTNVTATALPVPALGTVMRAEDQTLGLGEFIFLPGVASNIVGALVTYNMGGNTVTLSPTTGNNPQPVAVSMAANTSTTALSWYQIGGCAVIKKTAVKINPNVQVFVSATAGRIKAVASAGLQILGARSTNAATVASATSTINVVIDRPHLQGQIT